METEVIKSLEDEIKLKQEELNRLKYSEVYEAQDSYDAAKAVYEDAAKNLAEASKNLNEAKIKSGASVGTIWRRTYRF